MENAGFDGNKSETSLSIGDNWGCSSLQKALLEASQRLAFHKALHEILAVSRWSWRWARR